MTVIIKLEKSSRSFLDTYGGHRHVKHIKCVTGIYVCVEC